MTNPFLTTVEPLSQGILEAYEPSLTLVKAQLNELTTKQEHLTNLIHKENAQISQVQGSNKNEELFDAMKIYLVKLNNIKKDIKGLHEQSSRLKKRAGKIQEREIEINSRKEAEIRWEEDLIAKPSSSKITE